MAEPRLQPRTGQGLQSKYRNKRWLLNPSFICGGTIVVSSPGAQKWVWILALSLSCQGSFWISQFTSPASSFHIWNRGWFSFLPWLRWSLNKIYNVSRAWNQNSDDDDVIFHPNRAQWSGGPGSLPSLTGGLIFIKHSQCTWLCAKCFPWIFFHPILIAALWS